MRELRAYLGGNVAALTCGGVLLVLASVLGLLQPLGARWVLDRLAAGDGLLAPILVLCGLVVCATAALGVGTFLMLRSAEAVVLAGRLGLVRRILRLTMGAMGRQAPGDLLARVTGDTTLLRAITVQAATQALMGATTLGGALVLMGVVDLVLLATVLTVVLALGGAMLLVLPRVRRAAAETQEAVGEVGSRLERALGAFVLVKSSGTEERELARIGAAAEDARRGGTRLAGWTALAGSASGIASQVTFLVVLAVGGLRVQAGAMSASDLIAFLLYVFFLTAPVLQLINASTYFQAGRAALGRISAVQDLEAEDPGAPTPPARRWWSSRPASVRLEDVRFTYPGAREPALDGLDLDVPAGGLTALVGSSGAGKSTLFALLQRFHHPDEGRVLVDGRDARTWPLADLRATTAYVDQRAPVMAGTLRENLTYAVPEATDADVRDAVAACRLESVLERLGGDLDAEVASAGSSLSGGERQRIAVARALLQRPRLLLLDEVTSQLDAANEAALRDVVAEVARRTTVLVAAHRLSTIRQADRIVVLQDGRVRATGTHAELAAVDALYREFTATAAGSRAGSDGGVPTSPR
ncbi:ABC transporter ATP-binding protein [Conexibacter sp. SYSU D00693]|uniref:ABC transporter ATP-binding protein n=1 Tax=Conexibacter sp. SYSU D00693 TaxID=2812560 RepID=UPI00196B1902|nr:ABC transporter ATP-binding protein [Conexibacter sp. SYSU D00693]